MMLAPGVRAAPLDDAVTQLRRGDYAGAIAAAEAGRKVNPRVEDWWRVEAEALLTTGRYEEAYTLLQQGQVYNAQSIRLLLYLRQAALYTGRDTDAGNALQKINAIITYLAGRQAMLRQQGLATSVAANLASGVTPGILSDVGEAALLQGSDPKTVLSQFLNQGEQSDPPVRSAFLTTGQLALNKDDFDLAFRTFTDGAAAFPDDADMLYGMAASFRETDPKMTEDYATKALAINPKHVPTLLMLADRMIDTEDYDKATAALNDILKINPHQPEAFAYLAAIAALHNDKAQADSYRTQGLSTWKSNPQVDYLLGQKLSRNYRFELGAEAQQRALDFDPNFTPARIQLAEDYLRLGREADGWDMAAQTHKADPFDIQAFNLVTLHDKISQYVDVTNPHFLLRMAPEEAPIYGTLAMDMLERARTLLTAKYDVNLNFPVLIEFFPDPTDFSVRTFDMPDIGEFLGVTFGPVVTINSPTTHEASWEDVLWHEFTHVITLTKTHNQMPRWLSEGISVYEERQARPNWGQSMTIEDHDRILSGKMEPISQMSAAFLQAKTMGDTVFAYYESMLVVQFLIDQYGFDHLKAMLNDIGQGVQMNDALAKNFAPLADLDKAFDAYARDQAQKFAHGLDLSHPAVAVDVAAAAGVPAAASPPDPKNYYVRLENIHNLMDDSKWADARDQVKELNDTGFYEPGPNNLYILTAQLSAKLEDTAGEKAALTTVVEHEGDALPAVTRLLEIAQTEKNWADLERWADASIAIHPTGPSAWRALLTAQEQLGKNEQAARAGLVLLQLDPPDAASLHYRIARQMQNSNVEGARRQVLMALESAPRFRAAYELLADLPPAPSTTNPDSAAPETAVPNATDATPTPVTAQ